MATWPAELKPQAHFLYRHADLDRFEPHLLRALDALGC
jgi:hypothetical protein